MTQSNPAAAVQSDVAAAKAPDPRRHYASPEDLLEDVELDTDHREALLSHWKDEVDSQLAAEAEGMSASDPISAEAEARLAGEARRVNEALAAVRKDQAQRAI